MKTTVTLTREFNRRTLHLPSSRRLALAACLLFTAGLLSTGYAAPALKVETFTATGLSVDAWNPLMAVGLTRMVAQKLQERGGFNVVNAEELNVAREAAGLRGRGQSLEQQTRHEDDLERVDRALDLAESGQAGLGTGTTAAETEANADFLLKAEITQFGAGAGVVGGLRGIKNRINIFSGKSSASKPIDATVTFEWQIVSAADPDQPLAYGTATGQGNGTDYVANFLEADDIGWIGYDNANFAGSAQGKAAIEAIDDLAQGVEKSDLPMPAADQPEPVTATATITAEADAAAPAPVADASGKVLAVAGKNAIIISLGGAHGLKDGDSVALFKLVEFKDDAGNVVFTEEERVGELKLESVQADKSRCSYAGDETIVAGWVVKRLW